MARIASGELPPETKLPSERELSEQLDVSRMTVREAMRILDDKGLLLRRPGDGTYIARTKIERPAGKLVPFTRSMTSRGLNPRATLLQFEKRLAAVSIAQKLQIPVSSEVFYIRRLRSVNQEPMLIEQFTMPAARFPGLDAFDLEARSVYEIIETEYGVVPHHSHQSLEAVAATNLEADLLEIPVRAPLMLERRLAMDATNRPIEHGHDLFRGDRFSFVTDTATMAL